MKLNKRYAQKLRTHDNLLEGALRLMGEEKGLGDLSLREVAGEAGIVPAAFYRHFKNMEELGLSLVDDCGGRIQTIVGDARTKGAYKSALQLTIGFFFDYVANNRSLFRFIARERTGGNQKIREKIRESMKTIARELAKDMRMPKMIPVEDIQFASELIVSICFLMASDFLDLATDAHYEMRKLKLQTIKQVRLVFIGTIRGRKRKDKSN
ncbi:TetR family transcriptional regulator [Leptospira meyeri]|uniref:TetR family transcriptional regulator n=1 Tax=Leptospira meyeri TaxID=29508 RepID=UPI000C296B63|nr:TetR family transcriptional regulator [Leptospira meyeri]PKA23741.1 AcrR family transcriptional regulator [Leptospira sp. mixed culture ATI2-C-A1]MCW7488034.1 TetR family transcriptional regulator [Leptospira meyeri]TGL15493.1 TetR family transcriptional regulator [Leptospira meyeri]TGM63717.1 TetR family transcriptional regulator [Leptospira meyeri]TGM67813.1 TetR family transcriptional regulator [Leptospira meyeri]